MPQVIISNFARAGLARCRRFLADKNPRASDRASETIKRHLALLRINPEIGRPVFAVPGVRELIIGFGDSGYVARYRYSPDENTVYILAFRHQRETD